MFVTPANVIPALVSSLIAWRVYRRIRRDIGRQLFQPRRVIVRIAIFSLISILIAFASLSYPRVLLGFVAGLLPGMLLAWVGLRLTRCEITAEGRFYTPNIFVGVALSLLLVGRVVYRLFVLYGASTATNRPAPALFQSPLTVCLFGLLAGYYIVYYFGVFVRCRALSLSPHKANA